MMRRREALLERCFAAPGDTHRRYAILGVALDDFAFDDAVALGRVALSSGSGSAEPPCTLFFANAHTLSLAARSAGDRAILAGADFVFGDGTGVRWAARLDGLHLRANLNGTDFVPALLQAADGDGRSCFLLGAETGVVERAATTIAQRYGGWRVVGHHHGFLSPADGERVTAAIAASRPDLLLVGMGNPLQERWIAEHGAVLPVRLAVGVGALFGYLSGAHPRAPVSMRRLGLEWLFVLFTQRKKWARYCFGAPVFLCRIMGRKLLSGRVE